MVKCKNKKTKTKTTDENSLIIDISDRSIDILRNADINGVLKVPKMTDAEYDEVKYIVEFLGGHWREKLKGFVFDDNLENIRAKLFEILQIRKIWLTGETVFRIENQFYPTPSWLAEKMVNTANIFTGDKVLEPSAGRGAILEQILKMTDNYNAVEYNRKNTEILRQLGYRVNNTSFEKYYTQVKGRFDKVVMNPPFANKMDIKHTVLAYNLLKPGGRLVGLMAENSLYYDRAITHRFLNFLKIVGANIVEIPHGSFKESGTNVDVVMVVIDKKLDFTSLDTKDWD